MARTGTARAAGAAQTMPMTVGFACSEATMTATAIRPGGTVASEQYMTARVISVVRADMAGTAARSFGGLMLSRLDSWMKLSTAACMTASASGLADCPAAGAVGSGGGGTGA